MDTGYGARYRDLFERHWWWRAREQVILATLEAHRPAEGYRAVLDIGCGDGLFFDRLLQIPGVSHVEGVEPAESLVSPDGRHRASITIAPFDQSFDPHHQYSAILMLDVLEHLPDPGGALRHALSLLEPGGIILATVPAFMALWTRHDELNHHYTRYSKRSLGALAGAAGMRVDAMRYFFRWTAVAKLATRLMEALAYGQPGNPEVPPAPVNRVLYGLSRVEERLIGGLQVPFGSSLLIVGGSPR